MAHNVAPTSSLKVDGEPSSVLIEDSTNVVPKIWSPSDESLITEGTQNLAISELLNRWNLATTFEWKSSALAGTTLATLTVPQQLRKLSHHQNWIPFQPYLYSRCDITLRLQVNATRFQVGQLQFSWCYDPDLRSDCGVFDDSIFSRSQNPNVVYQVGATDSVELFIPYNNYNTFIKSDANFATATLKVLSVLRTSATTESSVSGTILYKLSNPRFHGLRQAEAEMFLARYGIAAAEGALNQAKKDFNRDRPTDLAKCVTIPHGSSSWSAGSNVVDTANPLRLIANATTAHPFQEPDEMNVKNIVRRYGLIGRKEWKTDSKKLFTLSVSPLHTDYMATIKVGDLVNKKLATYAAPPVSVISSMFGYWRGSLEYRFDIVCGPFHTGRLLVAFVPGPKLATVDQTVLMQSYYAIFDIRDQTSFSFEVPFVYNKPWVRTCSTSACNSGGIGYVYVMVLNNLVVIEGVSKSVDILVYLRGAEDFTVCAPRDPLIGLGFNRDFIHSSGSKELIVRDSDMYIGSWHDLMGGTKAICRYGSVSDHVTQCVSGIPNKIYLCSVGYTYMNKQDGKLFAMECKYFVIPTHPDFTGYKYLLPFTTAAEATAFVDSLKDGKNDMSLALNFYESGVYGPDTSKVTFELIAGQADERTETDVIAQPISNINLDSNFFFNENFNDLKTLCRRFQFYTEVKVDLKTTTELNKIVAQIPMLVNGLPYKVDIRTPLGRLMNKNREGIIPIISSGFRFYRGGLRLKICVSSNNLNFRFVHLHDYSGIMQVTYPNSETSSDHALTGYASYGQSTNVNRIVELEIPYYQPVNRSGIEFGNTETITGVYNSLGDLAIATLNKVEEDQTVSFTIYYALADDCRFTSFMGFPEIVLKNNIPIANDSGVFFQGLFSSDKIDNAVTNVVDDLAITQAHFRQGVDKVTFEVSNATLNLQETTEALKENVKESTDFFKSTCKNVSDLANKVGEVTNNAKEYVDSIVQKLLESAKKFGASFVEKISATLFQIAQVFANPTPITIGIAIASIIIQLGIVTIQNFSTVSAFFQRMWEKVVRPRECIKVETEKVEAQSFDENEICALSSTLLGILTCGFSLSKKKSDSMPKFVAKQLKQIITEGPRQSNQVFFFFQRNLSLIGKVWRWICGTVPEEHALLNEFVNNYEHLSEWAKTSQDLTNPLERKKVMENPAKIKELFACHIIAESLMKKIGLSGLTDPRIHFIKEMHTKLSKFVDEINHDCRGFGAKYEPFCFYLTGEPGLGKSYILNALGLDLMQNINYRYFGQPVYVRQSGVQYWNGVQQQPILIYDDFGCTTEMLDTQTNELFVIKSASVFNPPIAELENKKIMYNPKVVCIASNSAYPRSANVLDNNALWRRRDEMIDVQLHPKLKEKGFSRFSQLSANIPVVEEALGKTWDEIKKDSLHLIFVRYEDPAVESQPNGATFNLPQLKEFMRMRHAEYNNNECQNYLRRMEEAQALMPIEDTTIDSVLLRNIIQNDEMFGHLQRSDRDFMIHAQAKVDNDKLVKACTSGSIPKSTPYACVQKFTVHAKINGKREQLEMDFTTGHPGFCEVQTYCKHSINAPQYRYAHFEDEWRFMTYAQLEDYNAGDFDIISQCDTFKPCDGDCLFKTKTGFQYMLDVFCSVVENQALISNKLPKCLEMDRQLGQELGLIKRRNPCFTPSPLMLKIWDKIKTVVHAVWVPLKKSIMWIKDHWCSILTALGATAFFAAGVSSVYVDRKYDQFLEDYKKNHPQGFDSGDYRASGKKNSKIQKKDLVNYKNKMLFSHARHEACEIDIVSSIKNNMGTITAEGRLGQHFLAICDRYLLITKHFWQSLTRKNLKKINLVYGPTKCEVSIPVSCCSIDSIEASSLCILIIQHARLPMFRDIRKHIVEFDKAEYCPSEGKMMVYENGTIVASQSNCQFMSDLNVNGSECYESQHIDLVLAYSFSKEGLCGSPFIINLERPYIMSLHVAGSGHRGYGQPIFREMFSGLNYQNGIKAVAECDIITDDKPMMIVEKCVALGTIPGPLAPRLSKKSRLVPGLMFDRIFEHRTEPSILSAEDERWYHEKSPLYYGLQKHGKTMIGFEKELLDIAAKDQLELLLTIKKPFATHKDLLLDDEIFSGIPGRYKSLALDTSEGYPLKLYRPQGRTDKKWLFNYSEENGIRILNKIDPLLKNVMNHNMNLRKEGVVPFTIFEDSLKDCKIPIEKVTLPGKTRIFSLSPVEYTWQMKKYFGVFQIAFNEAIFRNETAIGIDANSSQWTDLVESLQVGKSDNFVTGDYKSFGDNLQPEVMEKVFDNIIQWYETNFKDNGNSQIRKILINEVMFSRRIVLNTLYQTTSGIPSGFPLTVEMNSLVNSIYMRYCWLYIARSLGLKKSMRDFNRNVRLLTYGDDLIMNVNKGEEWFNFNSIAQALQEHGISFTSADKDLKAVPDYISLSDATFLKRGFSRHPTRAGMWLAPLPKEVIEETINWIWKGNDPVGAAFESSRALLEAAFGQGPEYYSQCRKKLVHFFAKHLNQKLDADEWDDIDEKKFL